MPICDAQVHIWADETPERPWPPGGKARRHRPTPLGAPELLREMDAIGVDRAVLVPPSWEGDYNDLALAAAAAHPDRFAAMGRIDIASPDAPARPADWRAQKGMLGVRLTMLSPDHRALFDSDRMDAFWAAAETAGVPIMMLPPGLLARVRTVADRHPKLRLVIDHMGIQPGLKDEAAMAALEDVLALADCPNVAVKASALPCYTTARFPFAALEAPLRKAFDAFGPDRMFWGTDLSRLPCSYGEALRHFTERLPFLAGRDRQRVMGDALGDWIGWPY